MLTSNLCPASLVLNLLFKLFDTVLKYLFISQDFIYLLFLEIQSFFELFDLYSS